MMQKLVNDKSQMDSLVNVNLNNQYLVQCNTFGGAKNGVELRPAGVFWDIENCSIPRGTNILSLVSRIRDVIRHYAFIERQFVVVCDVYGVNTYVINELNKLQIDILHVSSQSKNAADEKLKQQINRFIMTQSQGGAVILISSDINFAPLLSDLKNRHAIPVILFHHQQVSPCLKECAHKCFDYDVFCAQSIASYPNTNLELNSDLIDAYLTVYNWSKNLDENNIKSHIISNSNGFGGRLISINSVKCEALVYFKCKQDAERCLQRCFNNRKYHGCILKGRILDVDSNQHFEPIISRNMLSTQLASICNPEISNNLNLICSNQFNSMGPILPLSQQNQSERDIFPIKEAETTKGKYENLHYCKMCVPNLPKLSSNTNFLFKKRLLSVHISLSQLSKQLQDLLQIHSGMVPLNSLPDCWFSLFNEEFDTITQPTVMLEHLISCIPTVQTIFYETTVNHNKTVIKYLVLKGNVKNDLESRNQIQHSHYLLRNLRFLLKDAIPNDLTVFPSILLTEIENLYQKKFNQTINYKQLGFSTMLDLALALKTSFNVYSYENDYLLAFNFHQQILRFAIDLNKILPKLPLEWNLENLTASFKQSLDVDLNMAAYGVCLFSDMITALVDLDENTIQDCRHVILIRKLKKILTCNEPTAVETIKTSLNDFIAEIIQFLKTLPELNLELKRLFAKLKNEMETKSLAEKITCEQFRALIQQYACDSLTVISVANVDFISLKPNLLFIEFGQRIVAIFHHLLLLSNNSTISIYQLFYYYLEFYEVKKFNYFQFQSCSVAKLFEKTIAHFFTSNAFNNYCLVYSDYDIMFCQLDQLWREEMFIQLFIVIFQSTSYKIELGNVKKMLHYKFQYSFGLSLLYEKTFQRTFLIFQDKTANFFVKLRPVYEFFSMCLTVLLLHQRIVFPHYESHHECKWTLEQLSSEFYDHFGIQMCSPSDLGKHDYPSLFNEFDCLFEVSHSSSTTISLKRLDLIPLIDIQSIANCNYCQTKVPPSLTDLN